MKNTQFKVEDMFGDLLGRNSNLPEKTSKLSFF